MFPREHIEKKPRSSRQFLSAHFASLNITGIYIVYTNGLGDEAWESKRKSGETASLFESQSGSSNRQVSSSGVNSTSTFLANARGLPAEGRAFSPSEKVNPRPPGSKSHGRTQHFN